MHTHMHRQPRHAGSAKNIRGNHTSCPPPPSPPTYLGPVHASSSLHMAGESSWLQSASTSSPTGADANSSDTSALSLRFSHTAAARRTYITHAHMHTHTHAHHSPQLPKHGRSLAHLHHTHTRAVSAIFHAPGAGRRDHAP